MSRDASVILHASHIVIILHMNDSQRPRHVAGSVRHAEKRRTSTCRFADAIATVSVNAYRSCVSESFREHQKQTCMATIVAHFDSDGHLQVMALGVGTKFLTERILREEERRGGGDYCRRELIAMMNMHTALECVIAMLKSWQDEPFKDKFLWK